MLSPKITSPFFFILGDRFEVQKFIFLNFLESIQRSLIVVQSQIFGSIESWVSNGEKTGFGSSDLFCRKPVSCRKGPF